MAKSNLALPIFYQFRFLVCVEGIFITCDRIKNTRHGLMLERLHQERVPLLAQSLRNTQKLEVWLPNRDFSRARRFEFTCSALEPLPLDLDTQGHMLARDRVLLPQPLLQAVYDVEWALCPPEVQALSHRITMPYPLAILPQPAMITVDDTPPAPKPFKPR